MDAREPFDWSAFFAGAVWWMIAVLVVAALAVAVARWHAERSRGGRD